MALFNREGGNAVADHRLEDLKQKYASVLNLIQQENVRLSHVHVQDNKLFIQGEAPSQDIKNKVWDQIKLVDPNYDDITADISVSASAQQSGHHEQSSAAGYTPVMQTYKVQTGDSLSIISKQVYGSANHYMEIFNANRDQLSDPNKIQPGMTLKIPKL